MKNKLLNFCNGKFSLKTFLLSFVSLFLLLNIIFLNVDASNSKLSIASYLFTELCLIFIIAILSLMSLLHSKESSLLKTNHLLNIGFMFTILILVSLCVIKYLFTQDKNATNLNADQILWICSLLLLIKIVFYDFFALKLSEQRKNLKVEKLNLINLISISTFAFFNIIVCSVFCTISTYGGSLSDLYLFIAGLPACVVLSFLLMFALRSLAIFKIDKSTQNKYKILSTLFLYW